MKPRKDAKLDGMVNDLNITVCRAVESFVQKNKTLTGAACNGWHDRMVLQMKKTNYVFTDPKLSHNCILQANVRASNRRAQSSLSFWEGKMCFIATLY